MQANLGTAISAHCAAPHSALGPTRYHHLRGAWAGPDWSRNAPVRYLRRIRRGADDCCGVLATDPVVVPSCDAHAASCDRLLGGRWFDLEHLSRPRTDRCRRGTRRVRIFLRPLTWWTLVCSGAAKSTAHCPLSKEHAACPLDSGKTSVVARSVGREATLGCRYATHLRNNARAPSTSNLVHI